MASNVEDRVLRALRRITRATDIHSRHLAQRHQLTGLSANANTSTALAAVHDPSTLSATRCQAC